MAAWRWGLGLAGRGRAPSGAHGRVHGPVGVAPSNTPARQGCRSSRGGGDLGGSRGRAAAPTDGARCEVGRRRLPKLGQKSVLRLAPSSCAGRRLEQPRSRRRRRRQGSG
jgi:hypothetical protein